MVFSDLHERSPNAYGGLLVLLASVFFCAMSVMVREFRFEFRADTLIFYRSLLQALLLLPFLTKAIGQVKAPYPLKQRFGAHLLRGGLGSAAMYFYYMAVQNLPLALASLFGFSSVFWAAVLARAFLGEKWTAVQVGMVGLILSGLTLTLFSTDRSTAVWTVTVIGITSGLLCGLLRGSAMTALRRIRQGLTAVEIVFFFGILGSVAMLPVALMHPELPTTSRQWLGVLFIGVTATLGQLLLTSGFRYATTLVATTCTLNEMLLNLIVGLILLHEVPPPGFYIATVFVVGGLVGLLRSKNSV